jgi:hypothetical protein
LNLPAPKSDLQSIHDKIAQQIKVSQYLRDHGDSSTSRA